jgi:hypothetical protein
MKERAKQMKEAPVPSNVPTPYVPPAPPPAPKPAGIIGEILIEEATLNGAAAPDAMRTAKLRRAGFNGCYYRARQANPTAAGTVRLELDLDPTGHVVSSSSQISGSLPQSLADCVKEWLERTQFPVADAGTAQLVVRMRFVPPGVIP